VSAPCNLPDYVERGGRQVWQPPYEAKTAQLLGMVFKGDTAKIDALLQRDLVLPAGGHVDYRCAHPHVAVVCAQFERIQSREDPDHDKGYIPEREVSIWCLAADMKADEKLVWYLPYVFTDNGPAVAAGREVYGYPKCQAGFDASYPSLFGPVDCKTAVSTYALATFGEDKEMKQLPVISVTRQAGIGVAPQKSANFQLQFGATLFGGPLQVATTLPSSTAPAASLKITTGGSAPPAMPSTGPPWVKPIIHAVTGAQISKDAGTLIGEMMRETTLVFLKQFRDVRCPTKACYQAITEAQISPHENASFDPLDAGLFAVTVEDHASHPIVSDLGLDASTPLKPEGVFEAKLDFDILTGQEVWRAHT